MALLNIYIYVFEEALFDQTHCAKSHLTQTLYTLFNFIQLFTMVLHFFVRFSVRERHAISGVAV